MSQIIIDGEKELSRKLSRLSDALASDGLGKATLAGGYIVESRAKLNAPVDTGYHRGAIRAELKETSRTRAAVDISFGSEYGIYLELGTSRMPARPHLRPALENNVPEITNAAAATLAGFIAQVLRS